VYLLQQVRKLHMRKISNHLKIGRLGIAKFGMSPTSATPFSAAPSFAAAPLSIASLAAVPLSTASLAAVLLSTAFWAASPMYISSRGLLAAGSTVSMICALRFRDDGGDDEGANGSGVVVVTVEIGEEVSYFQSPEQISKLRFYLNL
jgi:hypothetical protein